MFLIGNVFMCSVLGKKSSDMTFSVQGIGAMGSAVYRYYSEMGAIPKYIADTRIGGTVELTQNIPDNLHQAIIEQNFDRAYA